MNEVVGREQFLARRVVELEKEAARLHERIRWLTYALAEVSAGQAVREVSAEQFSLLAHEGIQQ